MNILELVKKYGTDHGEDSMWASVEAMSKYAEKTKEDNIDAYEKMKRKVYEAMNGMHYDDEFAECDIAGLEYTDSAGNAHKGAHWTKDQVATAWNARSFPSEVTDADKWVAANAMYADLCKAFSEEQILEAAYLFFFADEDWSGDGKVWAYMKMK